MLALPDSAIYVASARYGLVALAEPIQSYEFSLAQMTPAQRRAWGEGVVEALRCRHPDASRVYLLAGGLYRQALTSPLARYGIEAVDPVAGSGLGYARQVQWYCRQAVAKEPVR